MAAGPPAAHQLGAAAPAPTDAYTPTWRPIRSAGLCRAQRDVELTSVLFASHTAETSVFRVGSHHLSRQFAMLGVAVGHLSTPLSPVKALGAGDRTGLAARWRSCVSGPVPDETGRWSVVPFTVVPVQATASRSTMALRTAVPSLRRTVAKMQLGPIDHLLVDQPLFAGLPDLVRSRTVVYRPTDVYLSPRLVAAQARMLEQAHAVVATSEGVLAALPARARTLPLLVLSNGVDMAPFHVAGDRPRDASSVVYVGALDERLDWEWVTAFARACPSVGIDLYGPKPEPAPDDLPTNVRLLGTTPHDDLARTLSGYSVALMPFCHSQVNVGRSPMKLYEYLAAGLHVLATPGFDAAGDPPPGVTVVPSGADAAVHARRMLDAGTRNIAGKQAAGQHDWRLRAQRLLSFLDGL